MPKIIVNSKDKRLETLIVKGRLSATHEAVYNEKKDEFVDPGIYEGIFVTHQYIPNISSLEGNRYSFDKITVIKETFDEEDFDIIYKFIAEKMEIFPETLTKSQIEEIEKIAYKSDNENYGFRYGLGEKEYN